MNSYNEYIKMKNKIIETWYNSGLISLEEKNELYTTLKEIEEPNDFMDIPVASTTNEESYSLYNRGSNYLSNPFFDKNNTVFSIKSTDNKYIISLDNKIKLIENVDIVENNELNIVWKVNKDNSDFIKLTDINSKSLIITNNKNIEIVESNKILNKSNLWKLILVEKNNSNNPNKYYIESVLHPEYRLDFSDGNVSLSTDISSNNICIFEPVNINIKTGIIKSDILLMLEEKLEDFILKFIEKIQNENPENYSTSEDNNIDSAKQTLLNEEIKTISSDNINTLLEKYDLINIITTYLNIKTSEVTTKNFKNARFLHQFEKEKNQYKKIKEQLTDITTKTTNFEDNISILNENNNYDNLKFKALYYIRLVFIIISFLIFILISKTVYKMIN